MLANVGPLTRNAGYQIDENGLVDFGEAARALTNWFPLAIDEEDPNNLDFYSKANDCLMEFEGANDADFLGKQQPQAQAHSSSARDRPHDDHEGNSRRKRRWFAVGSNCRPFLHCPLWAPLSIAVIDRAASMSVLLWVASLDGRPRREIAARKGGSGNYRPTLHRIWDSASEAFYRNHSDGLMRWIRREFGAMGVPAAAWKQIGKHMAAGLHHRGDRGWRVHMPRYLCSTCCSIGKGRMKVIFVRSPFSRLVSYFRMNWLGNPRKGDYTWDHFGHFAEMTLRAWELGVKLPDLDPESENGRLLANFTPEDRYHTKAMSEWLKDPMLKENPLPLKSFRVLHVEHMPQEYAEMVEALCTDFGFCEDFEPFPRVNSFQRGVPRDIWASLWSDPKTLTAVQTRYKTDFDWFGYSRDPFLEDPVLIPGLGWLQAGWGSNTTIIRRYERENARKRTKKRL